MDLKNLYKANISLSLASRLRLFAWTRFSRGNPVATSLDPRKLSDHMLQDLGLDRPSPAWDESVGFWRDR
jgi:hypothetical protein